MSFLTTLNKNKGRNSVKSTMSTQLLIKSKHHAGTKFNALYEVTYKRANTRLFVKTLIKRNQRDTEINKNTNVIICIYLCFSCTFLST